MAGSKQKRVIRSWWAGVFWALQALPLPVWGQSAPSTLFLNEGPSVEHLSVEQGLSSNQVTAICEDREGFLWIGTDDGLNKYDGYSFTVYLPDPADPEH